VPVLVTVMLRVEVDSGVGRKTQRSRWGAELEEQLDMMSWIEKVAGGGVVMVVVKLVYWKC
jgi:hypothetical protein